MSLQTNMTIIQVKCQSLNVIVKTISLVLRLKLKSPSSGKHLKQNLIFFKISFLIFIIILNFKAFGLTLL